MDKKDKILLIAGYSLLFAGVALVISLNYKLKAKDKQIV